MPRTSTPPNYTLGYQFSQISPPTTVGDLLTEAREVVASGDRFVKLRMSCNFTSQGRRFLFGRAIRGRVVAEPAPLVGIVEFDAREIVRHVEKLLGLDAGPAPDPKPDPEPNDRDGRHITRGGKVVMAQFVPALSRAELAGMCRAAIERDGPDATITLTMSKSYPGLAVRRTLAQRVAGDVIGVDDHARQLVRFRAADLLEHCSGK